jgi:hypothetical protein
MTGGLHIVQPDFAEKLRKKAKFQSTLRMFDTHIVIKAPQTELIDELNELFCHFVTTIETVPHIQLYPLIFTDGIRSSSYLGQWRAENTVYSINGQFAYWAFDEPPIPPFVLPPLREKVLVLHAGAVSQNGVGLILPGNSRHGKSVLTFELVRNGFRFLSDELAVVDLLTHSVLPYPRAILMREAALKLFPKETRSFSPQRYFLDRDGDKKWLVQPELFLPGCSGEACPIRYFVFPNYVPSSKTSLTKISKAQALIWLLWNSEARTRGISREVRLFFLTSLLHDVECYQLMMIDLHQATSLLESLQF